MSMTMAVPCAFAAVTGNNGTTDVTVQTDPASTQCSWEAPTVIPFAADAAGNLTGPSADAVKIVNKSVFPMRPVCDRRRADPLQAGRRRDRGH